jgi:hypothetical protein
MTEQDKKTIQLLAGSNSVLEDRNKLLKKENKRLKKQLRIGGVSKSFTYKDISKVAEDLANEYSSDKKDPVWQDIKQDGIKAIQAFISKHL